MAEIIEQVGAGREGSSDPYFPLHKWFDGKARRLTREDFDWVHTSTVAQYLRRQAKARGLVLETETHGDHVDIQVVGRVEKA